MCVVKSLKKYQKISAGLLVLLLSGCVGTMFQDGEGKYIDAEFPDIRSVPPRTEACRLRNKENLEDIIDLEDERERMKARDEALRERAFEGGERAPS